MWRGKWRVNQVGCVSEVGMCLCVCVDACWFMVVFNTCWCVVPALLTRVPAPMLICVC